MVKNPDVTVRFRGVMEKCTYCVQRIRRPRSRQANRRRGRPVKDGVIVTACAAGLPDRAITFGDINDPRDQGLRQASPRNYGVLSELNTRRGRPTSRGSATPTRSSDVPPWLPRSFRRTRPVRLGRKVLGTTAPSVYHDVTEAVAAPNEAPNSRWWIAFLLSLWRCSAGLASATLLWTGTGIWGNNNPVGWGWAIVNFVFWVGIGHAGTLISAILFLFRQKWRTSINRFAEAMTIFAVICALLFPAIHVGRIWLALLALPDPQPDGMWPNFRSPLLWDVFAVNTYFTVSLLFWYVGLIPDLATLRDRAKTPAGAAVLRRCSRSAGAARTATGCTTRRPTMILAGLARRWCSRCTPSCPSTSPSRSCPAGTPRSSRPTSSPAPSSRASRWC
jgi:hypothetical protein